MRFIILCLMASCYVSYSNRFMVMSCTFNVLYALYILCLMCLVYFMSYVSCTFYVWSDMACTCYVLSCLFLICLHIHRILFTPSICIVWYRSEFAIQSCAIIKHSNENVCVFRNSAELEVKQGLYSVAYLYWYKSSLLFRVKCTTIISLGKC